MIRLERWSKRRPDQVMQQFKRVFGEGGLGLSLKEESPACIAFEGGGGYVTASFCEDRGGTRVDVVSREWDYHVEQFIADLR
jgi:hypothetical protein